MDLQLQGQHALITGGSKGIGLACARLFLLEGASVTLVSRDAKNLGNARDKLVRAMPDSETRVRTLSADLQHPDSAASMVVRAEQEGGPVSILVNCAGAARRTPAA